MNNILKYKISIEPFICRNLKGGGNITVYDIETSEWGNEKIYGKVVADVKNPFFEKNDYPLSGQEWLSYSQINKIFNQMLKTQKTFDYICTKCDKTTLTNNLSLYISEIDNYIIYKGNEMFQFCNTYLNRFGDDYKYYKIDDSKIFLEYFIDKTNIELEDIIKLLKTNLNDEDVEEYEQYEEKEFINEYHLSENKLNFLLDIKNRYDSKDREDTRNIFPTKIYENVSIINDLAYDFIKEVLKCNKESVGEWNKDFTPNKKTSIIIPINLTTNFNESGYLNTHAKEWVPGKRYFKDDIVIFNGKTYILDIDNEDGYVGEFNEITKEIYFDEYVEDNGFFKEYVRIGNDFTNWKRNIEDNENSIIKPITATLQSKLDGLKTYRKNEDPHDFFKFYDELDDEEKEEKFFKFKEDIRFNVEKYDDKEYYDVLSNIVLEENVNGEIGHDTLTYEYEIGTSGDDGLNYKQTHHRYKINGDKYMYLISDTADVEYVPEKVYEKLFNNDYTFKNEYSLNLISEPEVENNVHIDRGINSAWERHLKFSEISTLDDLISYGNGFFNVKQNNE